MISIFFLLTRRYQSPSKFILVIFSVKGVNFFRDITRIFSRWSVHIRRRPRISEDVTNVLTFVLNAFPSKIRDFLNSIRSFTHTFLFSHWFEFMLLCIFFENLSLTSFLGIQHANPVNTDTEGSCHLRQKYNFSLNKIILKKQNRTNLASIVKLNTKPSQIRHYVD